MAEQGIVDLMLVKARKAQVDFEKFNQEEIDSSGKSDRKSSI